MDNWLHRHRDKFTTPFPDAQQAQIAKTRNKQKQRESLQPLIPLHFKETSTDPLHRYLQKP